MDRMFTALRKLNPTRHPYRPGGGKGGPGPTGGANGSGVPAGSLRPGAALNNVAKGAAVPAFLVSPSSTPPVAARPDETATPASDDPTPAPTDPPPVSKPP